MALDFNDITTMAFSDFGTPAVIIQQGYPEKPVTVIFDAQSLSEHGVLTDKPQAILNSADLTDMEMRDITIMINGEEFRLGRPLADGLGLTTVNLTRI